MSYPYTHYYILVYSFNPEVALKVNFYITATAEKISSVLLTYWFDEINKQILRMMGTYITFLRGQEYYSNVLNELMERINKYLLTFGCADPNTMQELPVLLHESTINVSIVNPKLDDRVRPVANLHRVDSDILEFQDTTAQWTMSNLCDFMDELNQHDIDNDN